MGGLTCRDEYKAVAEVPAPAMISGWNRRAVSIWKNFAEILHIALDAGKAKSFLTFIVRIIDKVSGKHSVRT